MSKRDLVKKLDSLAKRAKSKRVGRLSLIDATKLFDWQAFRAADAETRERMRREHAEREAAYIAEQSADIPESDDPFAISAIVLTTYVPDADNEWRYLDDEDDLPTGMSAADYEAAKLHRERIVRENEELAAFFETETVDDDGDTDPRDPDPLGEQTEILYVDERFGPVTRAEHQLRRRLAREHADRLEEQRARAVSSYTSFKKGDR